MLRIFSLIAFVFVSVVSVSAAPKAKEDLEARFLAETAPSDLGKVLLAAEELRSAPFDLPVNNLSTPQTPPARVFSVWSVAKNLSLATVTLPEEGDSFIILLIPAAKGGYTPVVMRHDDPSFKGGDIYFRNLTNKTVLGFVGAAKFELAPGVGTVVTPKGARKEKFYDVGLGVREQEGDRVLATTRWPEDQLTRFYVFFYLNQETQRISYRAVDEFVEKTPPAK